MRSSGPPPLRPFGLVLLFDGKGGMGIPPAQRGLIAFNLDQILFVVDADTAVMAMRRVD